MFFNNNFFNNFSPFNNFSNYRNSTRPKTSYRNDNREIIINKLINDNNNYFCFDCRKQTNTLQYYDIKNAIFLCYNCALQHNHLPKETTEVITGDIRDLEEKYLLLLYYGGNKNLIEFIRRYYPLLERIERNNMYSTKAIDYYRKLIKSKVYNEPEPYMPRKLEGYNSIFRNNIRPSNQINYDNSKNYNEMMNLDENNNLNKSSIYGNSKFGNNKNKNYYKNEWKKKESDDINNKNDGNEDIEMKDDSSKKSEDSTYDEEGISDKENNTINNNKIDKKGNKIKNNRNENINNLTINQLGELSLYPDAKEIDEMD